MSAEQSKQQVRRLWEDVYNGRRLDVLEEIATPGEVVEISRFYGALTTACPDLQVAVDQMVGEEDQVADVVTFTGTHTGPLNLPALSLPATGKAISVRMVSVWQLEGGRIAGHWGEWSALAMMRQLGIGLAT